MDFWHHNMSQYESQITQKWTFDTTIWVASPIYALLSVIKQQMSPFDPFRGGGRQKGTMSPFFTVFFKRIASLKKNFNLPFPGDQAVLKVDNPLHRVTGKPVRQVGVHLHPSIFEQVSFKANIDHVQGWQIKGFTSTVAPISPARRSR